MAIRGWALLTTEPKLREWHKILTVQHMDRLFWARYITACRHRIEASDALMDDQPGYGSVCAACFWSTN